jgi:hypothetical protein
VQQLNGSLGRFTEEERDRQRKARKARAEFTAEDRLRFYRELLGYAREKGYKPGWASNKYREKFLVWPNAHGHPTPLEPSPEMRSWIKSRLIAWAKRRDKGERDETKRLVDEYYAREARQ